MEKDATVSLVVLTYNKLDMTKGFFDSLLPTTNAITNIIVIDNASTDGTAEWLDKKLTKRHPNVTVVHNTENEGFLPAANKGISLATGDFIFLANNDLVFPKKAFNNLLGVLKEEPNVGIVAPVTNFAFSQQRLDLIGGYKNKVEYTTPEEMKVWAKGYQLDNEGKKHYVQHVIGMLIGFKKELRDTLIKKDGFFFDPIFGKGNWEDNDLNRRILDMGLKIIVVNDSYVHHHGQATHKEVYKDQQDGYAKLLKENEMKFRAKWDKKKKVIAMIPVHNEYDHMKRTLESISTYMDGCVVLDDRSTDIELLGLLREYQEKGFIKDIFHNPPEFERHEGRDRDKLWKMALAQEPDWIAALDADEIFDNKMPEVIKALTNPLDRTIEAYAFPVKTLWNSEREYRVDSHWGQMMGIKLINAKVKEWSGDIQGKDMPFHAPASPKELDMNKVVKTDIRVKHFGYLGKEERQKKYEFYEETDKIKDEKWIGHKDYKHLIEESEEVVELRMWRDDLGVEQKISLCMMVKDETDDLDRCLNSYKDLVWEIIVAWNGTNPKTKEILEKYNARIIPYVWKQDFADARNTTFREAKGDWIEWTDADDYIKEEDIPKIKHITTIAENVGLFLTTKNLNEQDEVIDSNSLIRIFRNGYGIMFEGKVHEDIIMPKYHKGLVIPINVYHTGYANQEQTKKKLERNEVILKKEIEENALNPRPWFFLSRGYRSTGQWERALEAGEKYLELETKEVPLKFTALVDLATSYLASGKPKEAIRRAYAALAYNNLLASPYILLGQAYMKNNQANQALLVLETAKRLKEPQFDTNLFIADEYTFIPRWHLARLYAFLGNKERALENLKEALQYKPDFEDGKKLLTKLEGG